MEATGHDLPELSMEHREEDGVLVLVFQGTIELATVPEAKDRLHEIWPSTEPKILFDLSGVRFIDSAGLGFLIGSLRRATEAGGDLKLFGLSAYLLGIFKLVNLQQILDIYNSKDAARKAFDE